MSNTRKLRIQHCGKLTRPREQWAGKIRNQGRRAPLAADMMQNAAGARAAFPIMSLLSALTGARERGSRSAASRRTS